MCLLPCCCLFWVQLRLGQRRLGIYRRQCKFYDQLSAINSTMGGLVEVCCGQRKENHPATQIPTHFRQPKPRPRPQAFNKQPLPQNKDLCSTKSSIVGQMDMAQSKQEQMMDGVMSKEGEREHKRVVFEDFEIKGKLGAGSFGAVFKVNYMGDIKSGKQVDYAMKRIPLNRLNSKRSQQNVKLERFILSQMQNPFITQLKFAFKDECYIYLVMECGNGGSLDSFLNIKKTTNPKKNMRAIKFKNLGEEAIRFAAANVILGIEYLHSHNIMYRDLKPQNVIVFDDGFIKLTDFGLSKIIKEGDIVKTEAGTILYFAPEVIQKKSYTKMIDFWALGVFLYELVTSETPFKESQILARKKFREVVKQSENNRDWRNQVVSEQLKDLINRLLVFQPQQRLGAKGFGEIKDHPFFNSIDWESLRAKRIKSPLKKIIEQHPIRILQAKPYYFKKLISIPTTETLDKDWDFNHYAYSISQLREQKEH